MKKIYIGIASILVAVAIGSFAFYFINQKQIEQNNQPVVPAVTVVSFEECMNAGYPVMESYPRQCTTPDGKTYTEKVTKAPEPVPTKPAATSTPKESPVGKCYVGGCSGQICSGTPGAISTCIYREEYACYQKATCERQSTGVCGWTETQELTSCLNKSSQ